MDGLYNIRLGNISFDD